VTAPGARTFEGLSPATVTGMLAASELLPGDRVAGRFVIGKLLGMGGMGVVHLARDEQLGVDVALKLLRPELASRPDAFERFRNELLLARQVSSPHVVRIHDLVQHGEAWLLCMDYVPGRSLEHLIDVDGGLSAERALSITRQIAQGLAAAHHRGVIHRDLKPANVLVTDADEALITDFGVARSLGATGLTKSGVIVGTPEYLSPEQARAEAVDGRSDLYALGLILHEMLTGRVPFQGGTPAEMLAQRIVRSPPSVGSVKSGLPTFAIALCDRLLDLRPARRVQDADAVIRAIDAGRLPPAPASPRRRLLLLSGMLAMAFVGAAALYLPSLWRERMSTVQALPTPRPALAVIPAAAPANAEDAALVLGIERALTQRLLTAGVDVLDSLRVERRQRELGIARDQVQRMLPRLLEGLEVHQVLEVAVERAQGRAAIVLQLRDGTSSEVRWSERLSAAPDESVAALLGRAGRALGGQLGLSSELAAFPEEAQLQRLASISPLRGAVSLQGLTLDADASVDEWWWALETLERDARLTEARKAGREALQLLQSDTSAGAQRARALAEHLTGAPEAALARIEALRPGEADQPLRQLRARVLLALGRYEDAEVELQRLLERDDRNVDAWFLLGKAQLLMGQSQTAIDDALTRALVAANRLSDERMQADVSNALGIGYRQLGQLESAVEQFSAAANMRQALADPFGQATSLSNLAAVKSIQGQFDEANAALVSARTILEPLGDPAAMADLVNDIGLVAEERGDFASALKAYREALGFRQTSGDPRWIAESLINVGFAYYHVGEFDNAQVFLQQAEQAYKTIDDRAGAIRAEQGLGLSETARGNFSRARELLRQSLQAAEELQMVEEQSTALAAIAELDRLEGDLGPAFRNADTAASQFSERGDLRGSVEMHLRRAAIALDLGDWDAAAASIAALGSEPISNAEQRALWQLRQARLSNETGRADEALAFAEEALAVATASGVASVEIESRIEVAVALAAQGKPRAAREVLLAAESGLTRFASLPLRLEVLQARLRIDPQDIAAWRDARSLISKLPAYGREWQIIALAKDLPLTTDERAQAERQAQRSIERISESLEEPMRARFLAWAQGLLNPKGGAS